MKFRLVICSVSLASIGATPARQRVADPAVWARSTAPAALHGRVTDEHGAPVPGVQLTLTSAASTGVGGPTPLQTTTDSAGRFAWSGLSAGEYRLVARRLGFAPVDVEVSIKDGVDQTLDLRMTTAATRLDTVSVVGTSLTPARYGTSSKMDEFYRRKQEGKGHFFTREDIDDSDANNTATLLGRVPGIRAKREDNGVIYVHIASCVGSQGRISVGAGDDWGWEHVALIIDGSQVGKGSKSAVVSTIQPSEIEAIEVYTGISELPAEAMGDACAAVYIWTRMAGK